MKYVEDLVWAVLIVWLIPVFIVLGCVAVGVFLVRRTYWWMQGDSTLLTNRDGRLRRPWLERWPWERVRTAGSPQLDMATSVSP